MNRCKLASVMAVAACPTYRGAWPRSQAHRLLEKWLRIRCEIRYRAPAYATEIASSNWRRASRHTKMFMVEARSPCKFKSHRRLRTLPVTVNVSFTPEADSCAGAGRGATPVMDRRAYMQGARAIRLFAAPRPCHADNSP